MALPVVANPAFAAAKPDAVKGFVRALIAGINATVEGTRRGSGRSRKPMERRLARSRTGTPRDVIRNNILTGEVKRNGLGGIDAARFDRSIGQIAQDFKFHKRPAVADIFDDLFLPPPPTA